MQAAIPCEIRVRPVVRYVVTRYFKPMPELGLQGGSECLGEFDNERLADEVACAMRDADEVRCKTMSVMVGGSAEAARD